MYIYKENLEARLLLREEAKMARKHAPVLILSEFLNVLVLFMDFLGLPHIHFGLYYEVPRINIQMQREREKKRVSCLACVFKAHAFE